ncbi:Uncharacterised protein [Mycobacteroides abscessus subsp. abscessus]|nr:Uncharacterised protein [Mycobacteroides abscessus subsp. abscessus]
MVVAVRVGQRGMERVDAVGVVPERAQGIGHPPADADLPPFGMPVDARLGGEP